MALATVLAFEGMYRAVIRKLLVVESQNMERNHCIIWGLRLVPLFNALIVVWLSVWTTIHLSRKYHF